MILAAFICAAIAIQPIVARAIALHGHPVAWRLVGVSFPFVVAIAVAVFSQHVPVVPAPVGEIGDGWYP